MSLCIRRRLIIFAVELFIFFIFICKEYSVLFFQFIDYDILNYFSNKFSTTFIVDMNDDHYYYIMKLIVLYFLFLLSCSTCFFIINFFQFLGPPGPTTFNFFPTFFWFSNKKLLTIVYFFKIVFRYDLKATY